MRGCDACYVSAHAPARGRRCGPDFNRIADSFTRSFAGMTLRKGGKRISAKTFPTTHTLPLPGEDFKQVQDPCLLHEFNRVARVAMYNRMILQAFNLLLL